MLAGVRAGLKHNYALPWSPAVPAGRGGGRGSTTGLTGGVLLSQGKSHKRWSLTRTQHPAEPVNTAQVARKLASIKRARRPVDNGPEPTGQITPACVWLAVPPGLLRPTLGPTPTLEEMKRGCQRMEEERLASDKRTQRDIWILTLANGSLANLNFFSPVVRNEVCKIPEFLNASAPRTLT